MKAKLKKVWDITVMTYGIVAVLVAIIYIGCVGMGSDIHANAVRAAAWFGLGLWIIYCNLPKNNTETEHRLVFNQWVEYDSYDEYVSGRGGTTHDFRGCVIQTDTSLTISYQDKFGMKTSTYMRTFDPKRTDYVGLDNTWIFPALGLRCIRMNDKFIRLNYNQALLNNQN